MAKVKESMPTMEDYDHRIEMRRRDGPMKISHAMPMGKNKAESLKRVKAMIEKMFGSVK